MEQEPTHPVPLGEGEQAQASPADVSAGEAVCRVCALFWDAACADGMRGEEVPGWDVADEPHRSQGTAPIRGRAVPKGIVWFSWQPKV